MEWQNAETSLDDCRMTPGVIDSGLVSRKTKGPCDFSHFLSSLSPFMYQLDRMFIKVDRSPDRKRLRACFVCYFILFFIFGYYMKDIAQFSVTSTFESKRDTRFIIFFPYVCDFVCKKNRIFLSV